MKKIYIQLIISFLLIANIASAQTSNFTLSGVLDFINQDSLKRTVQDMQDFESRYCLKSIGQNKQVAQYLADRLKAYNIEGARIDSFYVSGSWISGVYAQYMYNVIGTLKGTGETDSTVIIGAHLDAISFHNNQLSPTAPGADDNATGCAVMIEMARIIFEKNLKPRHNIDFMAYDAEEIGLLGAFYDAEKRKNANKKVIVMLNNDMVANQPEADEWTVTLHWYDNALDVTQKARQALLDYTSVKPFIPTEGGNGTRAASDSWAYFKNNFKATFAIEYYFSPYYHSNNDLVEHLNFKFCEQIARMNFVLLADYADIDLTPNSIPDCSDNLVNMIHVFPNPTTGELRIENGELKIENIEVLDIYGRILSTHHLITSSSHQKINISHLNSGIYFLRICTDKGVFNKKIIKK